MRAELYTVAHGGPGHLSVLARPRGGEWLPDEVQGWLTAGVDVVVSLLTPSECEELELTEEATLCRRAGMTFIAFPLADRLCQYRRLALTPSLRSWWASSLLARMSLCTVAWGSAAPRYSQRPPLSPSGRGRSRHWLRWPLRVAVPSPTRPNSASGSSAMLPATSLPERSPSPERS